MSIRRVQIVQIDWGSNFVPTVQNGWIIFDNELISDRRLTLWRKTSRKHNPSYPHAPRAKRTFTISSVPLRVPRTNRSS